MKVWLILLGVAVLIVSVLYYRESQNVEMMNTQLIAVSNQYVNAEAEVAVVKTLMVTRVTELESTLVAEKSRAEQRVGQLQDRIASVERDLADEKNKLTSVEDERTKVVDQLTSVSNQLTNVRGQLSDLQRTHAATEIEVKALREHEASLELEKASLERQLNDLDTLKTQIRLVKRQVWEKHVAEWKRQDQEAGIGGNRGVLFKNGQWQRGLKPSS